MKVCVSSTGRELTSSVDPRFGRASFFIFIDSETKEYEAAANGAGGAGGAGVQAANLVCEKKADCVLTGNIGPNAFSVLQTAGIDSFLGIEGTVEESLDMYLQNKLKKAEDPSNAGHPGRI